ncbi:MAG: uroporphyrinogen decarboxylase, partial [Verrucomicrobia bacterium]|nr:uroporphyrinogen decarboxylase [Verrucomicrobiota bacterium]
MDSMSGTAPQFVDKSAAAADDSPAARSGPGRRAARSRFLSACRCQPVDRPPVWLMRQAGRALPEYRRLKARHDFLQLVRTPELSCEVTLQPVRRFDFDAAILFSDILVAAEGLGQGYTFRERGGIQMDYVLQTPADIARLETDGLPDRLDYISRALELARKELAGRIALIGFAGSPWTLANFMLEGGSVKQFTRAKNLFEKEPEAFARLMEKLTAAVTTLLRMQIAAGADAVQIFDSLGGLLPAADFFAASGRWMRDIVTALKAEETRENAKTPVIVFSKDVGAWDDLAGIRADVLGISHGMRLADVRKKLPGTVGIQGNLDPSLLMTTPQRVAAHTLAILNEMRPFCG